MCILNAIPVHLPYDSSCRSFENLPWLYQTCAAQVVPTAALYSGDSSKGLIF